LASPTGSDACAAPDPAERRRRQFFRNSNVRLIARQAGGRIVTT
jgi:hypothetical protein